MSKLATALSTKRQAYKFAEKGEVGAALKLISEYSSESPAESRIIEHSRAEVLMFMGKTSEALQSLLETKRNFGDHVSLLMDIVICYYALSDFKNWKFAFEDLKSAFSQHKDVLDFERRIMVELNIAKFTEEDGDVATAAESYLRLMKEIKERHDLPKFYRIEAQALRILSTFHTSGQLSEIYRRMISVGEQEVGLNAHFDVQQGLLLSELALVGPQSASRRLLDILKNSNISLGDKKVLYFDFMEEQLLHKFESSEELLSYNTQFKDLNCFELEIQKLGSSKYKNVEIDHICSLSHRMPLSSYLRLIGVYLSQVTDSGLTTELRMQFKLIISSLSSGSQLMWISRYKKYFLAKEEIELHLDCKNKILSCGQKSCDISRRTGFQGVIELLSQDSAVSTEAVILKIWNKPFDQTYYKSLRTTIYRLNEVIFKLSGIPRAVEINKQHLEIKGKIGFSVA